MTALPSKTGMTGGAATEGTFKAGVDAVLDYLTGLFGADGSKSTALNTLGAATPADLQAARDDTEADKVAAQTAAQQAQAAWTAALAANQGLNPVVRMNPDTVTTDTVIPANYNAASTGPITVADGVTVTVSDNATWSIT